MNPTVPHIFVEVPLKPSPDHYIEFVFVENMRGDILHVQKYWPSFTDPPKFACEGSSLTTSVTAYAVSSKYGTWKATVEVKDMPVPTDQEPGMALWCVTHHPVQALRLVRALSVTKMPPHFPRWMAETTRGPDNAFKAYKSGTMPKHGGSPFEPTNSGFQ